MGFLTDRDRNAYELLTKGVHSNLTDIQLKRLHEMAEEVRAIVEDANRREQAAIAHAWR